jgi:hypothetical protein
MNEHGMSVDFGRRHPMLKHGAPYVRRSAANRATLRQQFIDDRPGYVGQPEIAALEPEGEFAKIPAEQVPHCGVPIVDMHGDFDSVVAVSVRRLQVAGWAVAG